MKKSFKEITIMNAFLCLCVIMIHVTSAPVISLEYGTMQHMAVYAANRLLCFSVPGFVFLSGFKLHNKYKNIKINLKKFYTGRLKTIVVPYLISLLVYFLYYLSKESVLFSDIPEYIFLGTLAAHFYYIVIAVQFYLVFPALLPLFCKFPKSFTAVSFVCIVAFLQFFDFPYSDRFIGVYIYYFALGMLFSEYKIYEKSEKLCVFSWCATLLTGAIHYYYSYLAMSGNFVYKYVVLVHALYVTCAIFAIYTTAAVAGDKFLLLNKISQALSDASYHIYLYHILPMAILQFDVFPRYELAPIDHFLITMITIYGLTFIYTAIKSKLKRRSLK